MLSKKILICGATGFIGKHTVDELLDRGYKDITLLVRKSSNTEYFKSKKLKFIYGDISDKESLNSIEDNFDIIIHAAGYVNNKKRDLLWKINVEGTRNICQWALDKKVSKLVYVSSVAVISGNTEVPLTEDLPLKSTNLYGQSKLEAEIVANEFMAKGLSMVIVRPPMIYGTHEPHMTKVLLKLIKWGVFMLPNSGRALFHLSYVKNIAWFLAEAICEDCLLGETFFIADNEVLSGKEVFGSFAKGLEVRSPHPLSERLTPMLIKLPFIGKRIKFFVKDRHYSIDKLKRILKKEPPFSAKESLEKTAKEWIWT